MVDTPPVPRLGRSRGGTMRLASVAVGAVVFGLLAGSAAAASKKDENASKKDEKKLVPQVGKAVKFAISPALRALPPAVPLPDTGVEHEMNELNSQEEAVRKLSPVAPVADPVAQREFPSPNVMPGPTVNVAGISNADNSTIVGGRVYPPDTNGD